MSIQQLTGQFLGQYELRELLGVGGMGAVYRGYQSRLKREVAVKVLTPDLMRQPGYVERFTREAETAAKLEHRHIVPIYDYGTQQGVTYVVMRLLTGGTMTDRLARHVEENLPLPNLREIADVIKQLGSALDYAHSQGVIHRDIKSSNVMFDNQGSAYLVDFGIAKLTEATQSLTGTGVAMGTPLYMSPEQWRAETVSAATDQYALAVMTYALVTGRPPFEAPTPYALMHKHLNEPPTPPQVLRPNIPSDIAEAISRALAKNPKDRFPTCTAYAQAFEKAASGHGENSTTFFTMPIKPKPRPHVPGSGSLPRISDAQVAASGPSGAASRPFYRNPLVWGVLAVVIVIAGVLGALLLSGGGDDKKAGGTTVAVQPTATATSSEPTLTPTSDAIIIHTTPSPVPPTPTEDLTCRATTTDNANIRLGPDTTYDVSGSVTAGTTLTVIGKQADPGEWWQIETSGLVGWIYADLVTMQGDCGTIPIIDLDAALVIEPVADLELVAGEWANVYWRVTINRGEIEGHSAESDNPGVVSVEKASETQANPPVGEFSFGLASHAEGAAVITLRVDSSEGPSIETTFIVTVAPAPTPTPVPPTPTPAPLEIDPIPGQQVMIGEQVDIYWNLTIPRESGIEVVYQSTDPSVVSVSEPGERSAEGYRLTLTANAPGMTTVAVTVFDTYGQQDQNTFIVTVLPPPTPTPEPTAELNECQRADMNGSGGIDIFDVRMVAATYNSMEGSAEFVTNYDLDGNGTINIFDLRRITSMYGEPC